MTINIVIPIKAGRQSKLRLSPVLDCGERANLARYLCDKTLRFFATEFSFEHLSVVTPSQEMARIASDYDAAVIHEPDLAGLSTAAQRAAKWSLAHGFTTQLLIPADIAELSAEELRILLATHRQGPAVTVSVAADGGTNGLMTSAPDVIEFGFGPGSAARHVQRAHAQQIPCTVLRLPHLSRDIDTPEDWAHFHHSCTPQIRHDCV